jgi:hypothetical protein
MKIHLYIPDQPGNQNIAELVSEFFSTSAIRLGLALENIENLALAYEEYYQDAIKDLFNNASYTNNNAYLGLGKSGTKFVGGKPKHSILYSAFVFELILKGYSESQNIEEWEPLLQLGPYIVSHEIGHCKHNEILGISTKEKILNFPDGLFDLQIIHKYYFDIFIDEIAACLYGDSIYSVSQFNYQVSQDKKSLASLFLDLQKLKLDFKSSSRIWDVAFHSSSFIWAYFIQYSKLWAGKKGTIFEKEKIQILDFSDTFIDELNHRIDEFLHKKASVSLKNSNIIFNDLILIWKDFSNLLGYRYDLRINKWYCYWK